MGSSTTVRFMHLGYLAMLVMPVKTLAIPTNIAMVEPWDQLVHVGQEIAVNCTLSSKEAGSVQGLYFQVFKNGSAITHLPTKVILPLTAQLRIENATLEDAGMYFCFHDPTGERNGERASLFVSYVQVGAPPLSVEPTCGADGSTLSCSWCAGHMDPWVVYSMEWTTNEANSTRHICDHYGFDRCSCNITAYERHVAYVVKITGINDFGQSSSFTTIAPLVEKPSRPYPKNHDEQSVDVKLDRMSIVNLI